MGLSVLLQTDPHLSRTVVVSTKLDTRLPQFARGSDVEMFLRPPGRLLEPGMLGGCPFFTSAPRTCCMLPLWTLVRCCHLHSILRTVQCIICLLTQTCFLPHKHKLVLTYGVN